jgi:hypothetical protein
VHFQLRSSNDNDFQGEESFIPNTPGKRLSIRKAILSDEEWRELPQEKIRAGGGLCHRLVEERAGQTTQREDHDNLQNTRATGASVSIPRSGRENIRGHFSDVDCW